MRKSKARKKVTEQNAKKISNSLISQEEKGIIPFIGKLQKHPIISLLGVILFGVIPFTYNKLLHEPEIQNLAASVNEPFSIHFSLFNPNFIFGMNNMKIECNVADVKYSNPHIASSDIRIGNNSTINIQAGKTVLYSCPYNQLIDLGYPITQASIAIHVEFEMFGFKRTTDSEVFNWDYISKQWQKGKIVN